MLNRRRKNRRRQQPGVRFEDTKRHVTSHVIISCVCVRSEILRATPFHNDNDRCNCIGFTNAITTCYLDDRILQEIERRDTE